MKKALDKICTYSTILHTYIHTRIIPKIWKEVHLLFKLISFIFNNLQRNGGYKLGGGLIG